MQPISIYFMFLLGVVARIFVPYILAYLKENQPFDWRYATGQVVGALVGLITLWAADVAGAVDAIGVMGIVGAFAYGWFLTDAGRRGQKFQEAR